MRELFVFCAAFFVACSGAKAEVGPPGSSSGDPGGRSNASGSSSDGGSSANSNGVSNSNRTYPTELKNGIAAHGPTDGSGACSFPATPSDLDVASLNDAEYAGSVSCGACIRVKGALGEVTVRVVDRCIECEPGRLDLSEQAFAKIDDLSKGRVPMRYQTIACPISGNVAYHFKAGSSIYWTAIQLRNHAIPVLKLEYKRGDAFVEMKREDYNYFIESAGVGDQPGGLVLRVTATDGQVLEDTLPSTVPDDASVEGKAQFK
jgi:expansin